MRRTRSRHLGRPVKGLAVQPVDPIWFGRELVAAAHQMRLRAAVWGAFKVRTPFDQGKEVG